MKVSKIPGLGRFGVYIDDIDFNHLTDNEWLEIGKIHLETLVTIIRNVNLTPKDYEQWMYKWGTPRCNADYRVVKKLVPEEKLEELKHIAHTVKILHADEEVGGDTQIVRVTGKRNEKGEPLGMFAEGELLWHSNESGNLTFAPGVSLLGSTGMVGSSTGFCVSVDWYEDQTEGFRSELDELVCFHKFTPGRINPGLRNEQDLVMRENMCPEPIILPLVVKSPAGHTGCRYSINTIDTIVGMSKEESDKLLNYMNQTMFSEKYIYDHWYERDNDLVLFDNSVTQHRRLGETSNRLAYRIQYDYGRIAPADWNPYLRDPWKLEYSTVIEDMERVLKIKKDDSDSLKFY